MRAFIAKGRLGGGSDFYVSTFLHNLSMPLRISLSASIRTFLGVTNYCSHYLARTQGMWPDCAGMGGRFHPQNALDPDFAFASISTQWLAWVCLNDRRELVEGEFLEVNLSSRIVDVNAH